MSLFHHTIFFFYYFQIRSPFILFVKSAIHVLSHCFPNENWFDSSPHSNLSSAEQCVCVGLLSCDAAILRHTNTYSHGADAANVFLCCFFFFICIAAHILTDEIAHTNARHSFILVAIALKFVHHVASVPSPISRAFNHLGSHFVRISLEVFALEMVDFSNSDNQLIDDCLALAERLVRTAGKLVCEGYHKAITDVEVTEKTAKWDVVTEYDRKVEDYLIAEIKSDYPEHR